MKIYNFLNKAILVITFSIFATLSKGQNLKRHDSKQLKEQLQAAEIQNFIQTKNYVFTAQTVLPQTGRTINLTTTYDLRMAGDSLLSDLPYFGRAYEAPVNPDEGGIRFKSTHFNYNIKNRKKGGWDITIEPKDTRDVRQMFLSVFENGYATLNVISNNKQGISYNGYVKAGRKV